MISEVNTLYDFKADRNQSEKEMLPYERFMKFGAESLSSAELLAIIIRTGTGRNSALDIARNVLQLGGDIETGLNRLHHISIEELMSLDGIGQVKAVKLKCIAELSRRMAVEQRKAKVDFRSPETVADYYMEQLRHEEREYVILVSLNNKLQPLNETVISVGTVNSSLLSPREIYRHALKCGAVYVVLLHNHPGGDPTPSRADLSITEKVRKSGELLDIRLVDHIIIGDNSFISFKKERLLN